MKRVQLAVRLQRRGKRPLKAKLERSPGKLVMGKLVPMSQEPGLRV